MIMTRLSMILLLSTAIFSNVLYAEEKLADPTMPPNYTSSGSSSIQQIQTSNIELKLNSTIISPYKKTAVINGRQYTVGDEVQGAKIIYITHQRVQLEYQGKMIDLSIAHSFLSK